MAANVATLLCVYFFLFFICKKINPPIIKARSEIAIITFIVFYLHISNLGKKRPLILGMNGLIICRGYLWETFLQFAIKNILIISAFLVYCFLENIQTGLSRILLCLHFFIDFFPFINFCFYIYTFCKKHNICIC